jgi:hypothetical protein
MLLAHLRQNFTAGQATTVLRTPAPVGVEETRVSLTAEVPLDQCGYHPAHLRRGRQL